jgi:hypothetical protein
MVPDDDWNFSRPWNVRVRPGFWQEPREVRNPDDPTHDVPVVKLA